MEEQGLHSLTCAPHHGLRADWLPQHCIPAWHGTYLLVLGT